ncbi:hypothetical protein DBR47_14430 [Paucibacter sp. KBW04]|uniref:hypothetical protein n=1 Tax=Paucibacter sp. KBW04 TaxID=2153361 RepID=UPI000F5802C6|nr:hypothetical protein [Paucibacter sp. KBW04]RQO57985.1 hypothetical protein DBR47_14430 [Paucibacter sp. KBW04]
MNREQWLAGIEAKCEPVGECLEWQGRFQLGGKTPVIYVPAGMIPGLCQGSHSARGVMWFLDKGERNQAGTVLRAKCKNFACISLDHMVVFTRAEAPKEQSARGEFSTAKRNAAAINRARAMPTKLSVDLAREIRQRPESSRDLAPVYGVSSGTITAVRRGALWPEAANGSSVFNWRP